MKLGVFDIYKVKKIGQNENKSIHFEIHLFELTTTQQTLGYEKLQRIDWLRVSYLGEMWLHLLTIFGGNLTFLKVLVL